LSNKLDKKLTKKSYNNKFVYEFVIMDDYIFSRKFNKQDIIIDCLKLTFYCRTHKVILNCDDYNLSIFTPSKFKTGRRRRPKNKKLI
jgi:very-short-patch-repair endonuclease